MRRLGFRPHHRFVFVRPVRVGGTLYQAGQPVPKTVKRSTLRRWYRLRRIGVERDLWTKYALSRTARRTAEEKLRAAIRLEARARAQFAAVERASREQLILAEEAAEEAEGYAEQLEAATDAVSEATAVLSRTVADLESRGLDPTPILERLRGALLEREEDEGSEDGDGGPAGDTEGEGDEPAGSEDGDEPAESDQGGPAGDESQGDEPGTDGPSDGGDGEDGDEAAAGLPDGVTALGGGWYEVVLADGSTTRVRGLEAARLAVGAVEED